MQNLDQIPRGSRANRLLQLSIAVTIAIGTMVLVGWAFEIQALKSVLPNYITMKANTASGFILAALAIWSAAGQGSWRKYLSFALACGVGLLGGLTLLQYIFNVSFGIDEFLFADPAGIKGKFPPGRLAPITAINFMLINLAFASLMIPRKPFYKCAQFLVLLTFVSAFQAIVGYASGMTYSFGSAYYTQMAIHTAFLFCFIACGIFSLYPTEGFLPAFNSSNAQGKVTRILMGAAVLISPVFNLLYIKGQRAGLYDADFGMLIHIIANIIIFGGLVLWSSMLLYRSEIQRQERKISG